MILYPSKVSENLTPCNSGDSRKVVVLENDGAVDYMFPDGFTPNSSP